MKPPSEPDSPAAHGMTRVFGVLGGIASGKSAVARRLAGPDGLVLSADALAQEALDSEPVQELLVAEFGPEAIAADGRTDRPWLADLVFTTPHAREQLESWIHPLVRERISAELEQARQRRVPRVVLDVPLLLENEAEHRLTEECDVLVFVDVPLEERERRARENRGWSPGELERREALQLPLNHKKTRADVVLSNDGTLADLDAAVRQILNSHRPGHEP